MPGVLFDPDAEAIADSLAWTLRTFVISAALGDEFATELEGNGLQAQLLRHSLEQVSFPVIARTIL